MRRAGFHSAFVVHDNFIGDRKKAKALLEKVIPRMEQHSYPLRLTTEASIDLADDPEFMELMYRANFRSVFIGIETPRLESLKETKKLQNIRGDSLDAKLARIQNAGFDINTGVTVGFDSDDKGIFEDQFRFIQDNGITLAMVGMLYRRDIVGFAQFMNRCATHWHFYRFTRDVTSGRLRTYNSG